VLEGEELRDRAPEFEQLNARIVGISFDGPEDNREWSEMMHFDFPLLSDPDREIGALLDVKRPKMHPLFLFPRRVTYLIDPELVIARSYDVGRNIEGHAAEVLEDLRSLTETLPSDS
jgi:peroxiredoxin Q/BCP